MSEEEIIKIIKEMIQWSDHSTYKMALQGLLDLYQAEKEKNKELENADLTTVYMNGFYDGEKKWKDKIKQCIEKLEIEKKFYFEKQVIQGRIDLLQELLEEGDK